MPRARSAMQEKKQVFRVQMVGKGMKVARVPVRLDLERDCLVQGCLRGVLEVVFYA